MTERAEAETSPQRAMVIRPAPRGEETLGRRPQSRLEEALGLAAAISLDVVASEIVPLAAPRPATLLGQGAVLRIADLVEERQIALAVVDAHLSPVQQRNLERAWACKVIDRTGLILEIFGERARTREGRMQVELAALSYQKSRLVRSWTHLERQRGGFGFMGGPGETQIEADRRLIGERIARLKKELEEVKRTRRLHREARKRVPYPIVALVGYTNAGKSTLFNRLTKASVMAEDLLFATLDPTMRALALPSGRKIILSDTVGFVSDLPHELVAAFRATLEEVLEADVVVHVRDLSHPDAQSQCEDVEKVLCDLGLEESVHQGMAEVWNKIDLLGEERRVELENQASRQEGARVIPLSALEGDGADRLVLLLDRLLSEKREMLALDLAIADGRSLAWLYQHGEVVEREDKEDRTRLVVRLDPADKARFEKMIKQE